MFFKNKIEIILESLKLSKCTAKMHLYLAEICYNIYGIHQPWVEYISKTFKNKKSPIFSLEDFIFEIFLK